MKPMKWRTPYILWLREEIVRRSAESRAQDRGDGFLLLKRLAEYRTRIAVRQKLIVRRKKKSHG